jgi:arylsulfatase
MRRTRLTNAAALGISLGFLSGLGTAAGTVWANGDVQYAMFGLMVLRMRDLVVSSMLWAIAVTVPIAALIARLYPRAFSADRRWLRALGIASLLIAVLLQVGVVLSASRRTPNASNVVLIVVDALRADHLGSYGYAKATTPNLDRLAARSARAANAYSTATWTVPSMASLFTSTLPSVHRISKPPDSSTPRLAVLPPRFLLVSEVLRNYGYRTGMITPIGWVSAESGYDQGFDELIRTDRRDEDLVSRAERFIEQHANEPFFLYVHFIDLHDYYFPRNLFAVKPFPIELSPAVLALQHATPNKVYQVFEDDLSQPGRLSTTDRDFLVAAYDRELSETDRLIGNLLKGLERLKLIERTCVVVTADHGERFLEHSALVHGGDALYNEVLHIPFILFAPGHAPRVIAAPVSSLDIAPTILDALGIASPPAFQGRSVLRANGDGRAVIAEGTAGSLKLITEEWSYLYGANGAREELYELRGDPSERHNLVPADPETAAALRARLLAAMEASSQHEYVRARPEVATSPMSEALREQLRAIGYLE